MTRPKIDILGTTWGRLTVVGEAPKRAGQTKAHWLCSCSCGVEKVVTGSNLRSGRTRSCGCLVAETNRRNAVTAHGRTRDPIYYSWKSMIQRCHNANATGYRNYGGRGIRVCDRWLSSFTAFLDDMGERPTGCTLDRIDNEGNYEPGNCRWATAVEQRHNRRKATA